MASYTVKPGDTLYGIAQQFLGNGSLWTQLGYNGDPRTLRVGTVINIPGGGGSVSGSTAPAQSAPTSGGSGQNYFDRNKNEGYVNGRYTRDYNEYLRLGGPNMDQVESANRGVPTAQDILAAQMDKIKEQVSFLKDFTKNNPFAFDESLARSMAQDKFKPYYEEVLKDFVQPLQDKITRSTQDESRVLGELNREKTYGVETKTNEIQDAQDKARQGFAGSGLFGSGAALRATTNQRLTGEGALSDFVAKKDFEAGTTTIAGARERSDAQRDIDIKNRDIFGTGRAYDAAVATDVNVQRGQNQQGYSNRVLDALTSRYGSLAQGFNLTDYMKF